MLIAIWGHYEQVCEGGNILKMPSTGIGNDLLRPINRLYQDLERKGHTLKTLDMVASFDDIDALIFLDFPKKSSKLVAKAFKLNVPKYLVIFESELILPKNWDENNHRIFTIIFTWSDNLVDNEKYFKINFSHDFPDSINKDLSKKHKLCTLINRNKKSEHPLELYSKRVEAIRWFEDNYPQDFSLYGHAWDEYFFSGNMFSRVLNRLIWLKKLVASPYPSYRGTVENKKATLEKYRFCICFENAKDIKGYITEKIFDCFFSGCIPVYLGSSNISSHIPEECYIDMRQFSSYEEMYLYISLITDEEYLGRLDHIESFLKSEKSNQFTNSYFSNLLISQIA